MTRQTLFIFAHQDDEYFAVPWIEQEIADSREVFCVYLTDGGSRTDPRVRDEESIRALKELGVDADHVGFIGGDHRASDGRLYLTVSETIQDLRRWLDAAKVQPDFIYAPDWEGGHQDHDAAYLVALQMASEFNAAGWSFSLYNAYRCPRIGFRALALLERPGVRCIRYSLTRAWRYANNCWQYASQRRTWIGLFPESLVKRLFRRAECVNAFDRTRPLSMPHDGPLLYERMFGVSAERFFEATEPVRRTLSS